MRTVGIRRDGGPVEVAALSADGGSVSVPAAEVELVPPVLPEWPRRARLREVEAHLGETWSSWIGGPGPGEVFHHRLQSPVLIAELDHHCGVFPDHDTPQPFPVPTVLRTPHGNDHGRAWVRQWQAAHPSDRPDPTHALETR